MSQRIQKTPIGYSTKTSQYWPNNRKAMAVFGGETNVSLGARLRPLRRILLLIQILKTGEEMSMDALVRTLKCNAKTVKRDIYALVECGFEIQRTSRHGEHGRYVMTSGPL